MAAVFRRSAAIFGVLTVLIGLAIPPVHVHLGEDPDDHDHSEGIIHAHWAAHAGADGHVELMAGNGRLLFLDQSATARVSSVRVPLTLSVVIDAPTAAAPHAIPGRTHAAAAWRPHRCCTSTTS